MTSDPSTRLTEACPHWCDRDHDDHPPPPDGRHQSTPIWLPVTTLHRSTGDALPRRRDAVAEDAWLLAMRYMGDRETWVAIATEHQQIELTPESAARLHDALGTLLTLLTQGREPW